jgi:PAS domain S-box-containing protein
MSSGRRRTSRQARLADILTETAEAILAVDGEGRIMAWNRGAEILYGHTAREMLRQGYELLLPPENIASGEVAHLGRAIAEQAVLRAYETERLARDGRRLCVEITATLLRDREGLAWGRSEVHRDLNGRRRLDRERLQREQLAAVGRMARHMIHDVRNPLFSLQMHAELLRDTLAAQSEAARLEAVELLRVIDEEVAALGRLTGEYMHLASLCRLRLEKVDLGDCVQQVAEILKPAARERGVELRIELQDVLPEVAADPEKLRMALLGVGSNALDAMASGGTLRLRLRRDGEIAAVSVSDSGPGVPAEIGERIFEPFFTTKPRRVGLGLALCRQILHEHGGRVEHESSPGGGATFTLLLPLGPGP